MSRFIAASMLAALCLGLVGLGASGADDNPPPTSNSSKGGSPDLAKRLMALDKNKDGKLDKNEITDERLLGLFNRADRNRDGVVTEAEIRALMDNAGGSGFGEGGRGEKGGREGGREGKGGRGKGERGQRGFGGQPGQILPPAIRSALGLSDTQNKEIDDLQREAASKIEKILTDEQKGRLREWSAGGGSREKRKRD